jgi:hypothetical protein
MRFTLFSTCVATLLFGAGVPGSAEAGDHKVRFGARTVVPTGDLFTAEEAVAAVFGVTVFTPEVRSATGFMLGYEIRINELLGVSVGLSRTTHDVALGGETIAELSITPLLVGPNFHVVRRDRFSIYLGPQIGFVVYGAYSAESEHPFRSF